MGCVTASLATRGVLCCPGQSKIVQGLAPSSVPHLLEPDIHVPEIDPPSIAVTSAPPTADDLDIRDSLAPELFVDRDPDPVPAASTNEPSSEPSVKIRPLEDLVPEIVKKKKT